MLNYLKPQTPIEFNNNYIYPLTTVDQVIIGNGERLNSLFKKTIKENVTLNAANWSNTKPYTQTITLTYSVDDYDIDTSVAYGDGDNTALHAAAGCLSYIKKNYKKITFYCLKNKPNIDIPIEITGTCRNTIATVEDGVKLNFDVVGGTTEPSNPKENTIWVNTDVEIPTWTLSPTQPAILVEGKVWISLGTRDSLGFNALKKDEIVVYPLFAKQYINGALVDKVAKTYQNGAWVDWYNGELFVDGNQYTNITGGWDDNSYYYYGDSYTKVEPTIGNTISLAADYRTVGDCCIAGTQNPIDLRNRNKICIDVISTTGNCYIAVTNSNRNLYLSNTIAAASLSLGTVELDVSSINESYYIAVFVVSSSTVPSVSCEVNNIRLN